MGESQSPRAVSRSRKLRRFAARLLVLAAVLVALAGVMVLIWSHSATREWQRVKAQIEADGETFDLMKLLPSAPADAENFCAIPELKDVTAKLDDDPNTSAPEMPRKASGPLVEVWKPDNGRPGTGDGPRQGVAANSSEMAAYFRKTKFIELPPTSDDPARDILAAIGVQHPEVAALTAAIGRSKSQITPAFAERRWTVPFIAQRHTQWSTVTNAGNILRIQALAAIGAGNKDITRSDIVALLKLSEAAGQEPFLLSYIHSVNLEKAVHHVLWEALRAGVLSDEILAEVLQELSKHDGRDRLLYALRTELILNVDHLEHLRDEHREETLAAFGSGTGWISRLISRLLPAGVFDRNASFYCSELYRLAIRPLKTEGFPSVVGELHVLERVAHHDCHASGNPFREVTVGVAARLLPTTFSIVRKGAVAASTHDQAMTAIALERFNLQHHRYPTVLSELVPAFVPKLPLDTLSGIPLGYRRTEDGRYMIWSAGFDGTDDNGKIGTSSKAVERLTYVEYTNYKGDWVWQYTPVHP